MHVARVFFVWISVFNLFAVSVFWSFMADLYRTRAGQAAVRLHRRRRLGGRAAGPALTVWLAVPLGPVNLLIVAAVLLELAVLCAAGWSWLRPPAR